MPSTRRIKKKIRRAARRYGVDPDVLEAQIGQESGFRQGLTSSAGARDIAQFIPSTAKAYGVTLGDNRVDDDIDGAARYMRDNLKRTGGNYKQALSIYNSGRPDGYKQFDETRNYVASILGKAGAPKSRPGELTREPAKYKTVPGKDRSAERQALKVEYLGERGKPGAIVDLALGLQDAQDTPDRKVKVKGSPIEERSTRTGPLASPAKGKRIGSPYAGTHTLGNWQSDNAEDIALKPGTPVRATHGGKVVKVKGNPKDTGRFGGYQVTIQGKDGGFFYAHLRSVRVRPGQRIKAGAIIGGSGVANGVPHLHYGVERGRP